ncbi:MAG: DUF368 domain-containing protein [Clostridia bacterium]|nr:DUF368 domain-containing protein [Clostridia bacterium]
MRKLFRWLYGIVQGALIGGGAILPGISGGVLSVLFGVYRPLMELLTHPVPAIKKHYKLFIPIGIGAGIGILLFAKLVAELFTAYENYAVCLFLGLIVGTIPMLYKDAGKEGRSKGGFCAMILSFVFLLGALLLFASLNKLSLEPNIWWYLFCGAVWGLSLIVPGLSSSSILIFMGLYTPMSEGIGDINVSVILPVAVGIITVAVLLARPVNKLFDRHYTIASHAIVGLVTASAVTILPTSFSGVWDVVLCIALAAAGFFIAYLMDVWGKKLKKDQ